MKISIHRVSVFLVLNSLLVSAALFACTTGASQLGPNQESEPDGEPEVVLQDEQEALAADIAILADETGLPAEHVANVIAFQQAFAEYSSELFSRFPDQISAVWVEPVPDARGHIQFIGEVPPEVTAELEAQQAPLNPRNVILTGGGMISMADHRRRAELAAYALEGLGYQNAITFFDADDQVIRIELQLPEGAAPPDASDLVEAVQDRVRVERDLQGRAAKVEVGDLELTILRGAGPIIEPQQAAP